MQSYGARLFGNTFLNLCQISVLKEAIGSYVYDNTIFLKWGILNVPFCSIFVPFHIYLIMTLVVPWLHNMFMVLLIFARGNFNIGATKPIFLDFGSLRGEGGEVCACVGMVCYHYIVHILNSSKILYFLCLYQQFVQYHAAKLLDSNIFLCFVSN